MKREDCPAGGFSEDFMTKKKMVRLAAIVAFLPLFCVGLDSVLANAHTNVGKLAFNGFYAEEENTLDGVYLGSSAAYRFWNPTRAYETEGISVFCLATPSQPIVLYPSLIEEVEKTQSPQVYVLELRDALRSADRMRGINIRRVTDNMKQSATRMQAIDAGLAFAEQGDNEVNLNKAAYYVPLTRYFYGKSTLGDASIKELLLEKPQSPTKGFFLGAGSHKSRSQEEPVYSKDLQPLEPESRDAMEELLAYCATLDAEVLFVLSPYAEQDAQVMGMMNALVQLVEESGYPILNFNTKKLAEELGIDWSRDYYNQRHMNLLGAQKYTDYLADYLVAHYDLEDHRSDAAYASWDEAYGYYLEFAKEK